MRRDRIQLKWIRDSMTATATTFQAIVKGTQPRTVVISESEYGILQDMRRMFENGKQHQMLIGLRDGKYYVYHVNLHTTFVSEK